MALPQELVDRFEHLTDLIRHGGSKSFLLMECRRKEDGATVALICSAWETSTGSICTEPLAQMLWVDDIDLFEPPNPDSPEGFGGIPTHDLGSSR